MKRLLLILLLSKIGFAQGQTYTPFPDSGAVWVNHVYINPGSIPEPIPAYLANIDNFCVNGEDTIINSEIYTRITQCGIGYHGALRDNGGQVFYVPKDSTEEFLLYDFTVNVGDTIPYPLHSWTDYDTLIVEYVGSTLIEGNYIKQITFENSAEQWIEGIGSTTGLFVELYANDNVSGGYSVLRCYSRNDSTFIYFGGLNFYNTGHCPIQHLSVQESAEAQTVNAFPNPVERMLHLSSSFITAETKIWIYNALGEKLEAEEFTVLDNEATLDLTSLSAGIYFIQLTNSSGFEIVKIVKQD